MRITSSCLLMLLLTACGVSHSPDAGDAFDGSTTRDAASPRDGAVADGAVADGAVAADGSVDPPVGGACVEGLYSPCTCDAGVPPGWARCVDGVLSSCECGVLPAADGPEPPGGCTGDAEWCDGYDNDCDGVVDNGHVCPDSSTTDAVPFTHTVWVAGWNIPGGCGYGFVQQVWPTAGTEQLGSFACPPLSGLVRMRASDRRLFYGRDDIREDVSEGDDPLAATPPCFEDVLARPGGFAFGPSEELYYRCGDEIRRGNGVRVADAPPNWHVEAVLSSGRILASRPSTNEAALLDVGGAILSRAPVGELSGTLLVSPDSASTEGDTGAIAFERTLPGEIRELVVMRVDGDGTWHLVRRVRADHQWHGTNERALVLPDGTAFYGALVYLPAQSPRYLIDGYTNRPNGRPLYYYELALTGP